MTETKDPRVHFEPDHHASAAGRYFHHRDRAAKTMGTSVATVDAEQWHPDAVIEMEGVTILSDGIGPYVLLSIPRGRRHLDDGDWIVVSAGQVSVYSDAVFRERFEAV